MSLPSSGVRLGSTENARFGTVTTTWVTPSLLWPLQLESWGVTFIDKSAFYQMLMHSLPSGSSTKGEQLALPFRALSWDCAEVHLALFVHRVSGFPKGLYFLVRNEDHLGDLKRAMRSEFEWRRPDGCPEDLPLYMLAEGDCQRLAKGLSCHQVTGFGYIG